MQEVEALVAVGKTTGTNQPQTPDRTPQSQSRADTEIHQIQQTALTKQRELEARRDREIKQRLIKLKGEIDQTAAQIGVATGTGASGVPTTSVSGTAPR